MKSFVRACLIVVAASIMLSGCATYNLIKPMPAQSQAIKVVYNTEGASGWNDLPIGVYRVPQSQVIVAGYNRGGGAGFLFGVAGVLIQDAVETGAAKSGVKNVQSALQIVVTNQAQSISNSLIDSGQFGKAFSTGSPDVAPVLSVEPYIVVSYVSETEARPFVVLRATLRGPTNNSVWTSRYIASIDKALPMQGDRSLTAEDRALLKAEISKDLETAIKVMLADVASPKVRDESKLIYVESTVPFLKQRLAMVGYEIAEDDRSVVIAPKVADAVVFSGVHILDKSVTTYRAAMPDDKIKILDDSKK